MEDNLIDKLDGLITELDQYYHEIQEGENSFDDYVIWAENWVRQNPDTPHKVRRRTSISTLLKDLREIRESCEKEVLRQHPAMVQRLEGKAHSFITLAKKYLSFKSSNGISDRTFYFYFLDISGKREPILGRAVLRTREGKYAYLENIPGAYSENYEGTYRYLSDNVVFFDMENSARGAYSHKKNKRLHIKIKCENPELEIFLGSYNTFDRGSIYTGSAILEQVGQQGEDHPKAIPLALSHWQNPEEFRAVDESIRRYLGLKIRNYHKVPDHIPDKETLKEFLDNYHLSKNRNQKFLELENPRVFIATPNASFYTGPESEDVDTYTPGDHTEGHQDKQVEQIIKNLSRDYSHLELVYKDRIVSDERVEEAKNPHINYIRSPKIGFKLLQHTRYFILILPQTTKASLSLVQLGWALAYCKHILVIYCKNSVSYRLRALDILTVEKKSYMNLEAELDEIYMRIKRFIDEHSSQVIFSLPSLSVHDKHAGFLKEGKMKGKDRLSKLFEFLVKVQPDYKEIDLNELASVIQLLNEHQWQVNKATRAFCEPHYTPKPTMSKKDFDRAVDESDGSLDQVYTRLFAKPEIDADRNEPRQD